MTLIDYRGLAFQTLCFRSNCLRAQLSCLLGDCIRNYKCPGRVTDDYLNDLVVPLVTILEKAQC